MKGCYHTEKAVTDGQTDRQTDGRQERVLELDLVMLLRAKQVWSDDANASIKAPASPRRILNFRTSTLNFTSEQIINKYLYQVINTSKFHEGG